MKRLQIGIDINEANVEKRVGTGQYTYNILKVWHAQNNADFHLYYRDPLQGDMPAANAHWHYHHVGPRPGWLRLGLPLRLLMEGRHNGVFWSPAHYMPQYIGSTSVVTIHDLAYEYFPELFLPKDLYKLRHWTRAAVAQATHIIAVSEATKRDIVASYGIDSNKISVVLNGYDAVLFNTTVKSDVSLLTIYDLVPQEYLLFVGTIQPRKNVIKLVQAFELLKQDGYTGKLVLAGKTGWLAEETLAYIQDSSVLHDIVMTGYISDEVRKVLYTHADVYVLPSLYEGFGVPVIEAMACGAPVVVANNSSLPEVVGDAGLLCNEKDAQDILRAILEMKKDRSSWGKKSLAQAQHFSWEKCAQQTFSVLTDCA